MTHESLVQRGQQMQLRSFAIDRGFYPTMRIIWRSKMGPLAAKAAERYLDVSRDFSYDFSVNGEEALVKCCLQRLFVGATIFDAGANQGDWTALALKYAAGPIEVHLFEMSPTMVTELKQRYGDLRNVHINSIALSDQVGEAQMEIFPDAEGINSLVVDKHHMHDVEFFISTTKTTTGSEYCSSLGISQIDVLKIDVEGAEGKVIEGFRSLIEKQQVGVVQWEYGHGNAYTDHLMHDFWTLFEGAGYVVGKLRQKGVEFSDFKYWHDNFNSGPNFVAAMPQYVDTLTEFSS
jgi:FkbM family methyltransferase